MSQSTVSRGAGQEEQGASHPMTRACCRALPCGSYRSVCFLELLCPVPLAPLGPSKGLRAPHFLNRCILTNNSWPATRVAVRWNARSAGHESHCSWGPGGLQWRLHLCLRCRRGTQMDHSRVQGRWKDLKAGGIRSVYPPYSPPPPPHSLFPLLHAGSSLFLPSRTRGQAWGAWGGAVTEA